MVMDSSMWSPSSIADHELEHLRHFINEREGTNLANYDDLHEFSVQKCSTFWSLLLEFIGIKISHEPNDNKRAFKDGLGVSDVPIDFFPGLQLNFAENLLHGLKKGNNVDKEGNVAIIVASEHQLATGKEAKKLTWREVKDVVRRVHHALRVLGVGRGDVVGAYLPNSELCVYTMLAAASLGAVFTAASADLGVDAVVRRFGQVRPKVMVSVDAVFYNGKTHSHLSKAVEVAEVVGVEHVVIAPNMGDQQLKLEGLKDSVKGLLTWDDFLQLAKDEKPISFEQVPFNHPLFILYSSGTTGSPKCIVHGAGGTLLKHMCEHIIQGNRKREDVVFYYTTVGWMMWNWLVSALAIGAPIVLYDGSPMQPEIDSLWSLVDLHGITVFGTSAKWLAVQEAKGVKPRQSHNLGSLQVICSTGSPLSPESFDYVYRDIKKDLRLSSIIGGTDIIGCFMGEISVKPVYRGEVQGALLGCAIEAFDENGKAIVDGSSSGELVCTKPFVSQPVRFWNDSQEHKLYKSAYFFKFDGVWAHGDLIHINPRTRGMIMLGRSDAVLNPNGVRFGSVEIYNVVEKLCEINDALCVSHVPRGTVDERALLFVKLNQGHKLSEDLIKRIRNAIRNELSAKHVPAVIMEVGDVPYTATGKKVELAVKRILAGNNADNASALRNPQSLDIYRHIAKEINGS